MATTLDLTEFDLDLAGTEQQVDPASGVSPGDPDAGSMDLAEDSAGEDQELRLTIPGLSAKLNILGVERSPDEIAGWSDAQIREAKIWAETMDRAIEENPEGEMPAMPDWMLAEAMTDAGEAPDLSQDARSEGETTETASGVENASGSVPDALDAKPTPSSAPKSGQGASLAEVKASIQTQMVEKLRRLRAAELLYEEAKEEAAGIKKSIKAIQRRLNQLVQDLADCEAGTYQQLIPGATAAEDPELDQDEPDEPDGPAEEIAGEPSDEGTPHVGDLPSAPGEAGAATETADQPQAEAQSKPEPQDEDYGGAKARAAKDPANHTSVREIGLTESQFEKLGSHEPPIDTVADLERAIRDGYLQKVKGIGTSTVDKITDKLMDWRVQNPVVA